MTELKKIGLIVGREWSFPPAFLEEVNSRDVGVIAEYVKLGGTRINEPVEYDVIVDRLSHLVPYFRTYLKNAVLQGTYVINNPFLWSADDRFFEFCLADALDVPTPRTVVLPMKSYADGVVSESLRNLIYPLDWNDLVEHVGLPAILKAAWGNNGRRIYRVNSVDELIHAYDCTGTSCMLLQENIDWDQLVHCFCIGQNKVLPMAYEPGERRYLAAEDGLKPAVRERVIEHTLTLNRALGYDTNNIEFAVRDGIPYAIDIFNAAPDIDINSMTPRRFEWMVVAMADFCIEMALKPNCQRTEHRWAHFLSVSRPDP